MILQHNGNELPHFKFKLSLLLLLMTGVLFSNIIHAQRTMELIGQPNDSYGYMIWSGDTSKIEYYRYTISERIQDATGTSDVIVERGEIWDRQYLYISPKYWQSDLRNGKIYTVNIFGVSSSGIDLPDEDVFACSGCEGFEGCRWECVSSHYAYHIRQTGGYLGTGSFNYQLNEAREIETDGTSSPYYEWFSQSEFNSHIQNPVQNPPSYRNMVNYNQSTQFFNGNFVSFPANGEIYHNGWGYIIEGDIYGIKKGMGQWYVDNGQQVVDYQGDLCELDGSGDQATFSFMRSFMNDELDLSSDLQCAYDLGQGGYVNPDDPDYEKIVKTIGTIIGDPVDLGDDDDDDGDDDGDGDGDGDGGIIVVDDNWELYVSALMNFTVETFQDTSFRYSEMLMEAQMFNLAKLGPNGYESFFEGNFTNFVDSLGVPSMPVINFTPGLYRMNFKRTGFPVSYGIFEVRERFQVALPHKDFFNATIYPNPNTNPHFFVDVQTTARLWVRYEIFDGTGNKVFQYTIQLPQGHDGTHRMEPDPPLPNGFLYHRFSFIDGSSEVITTIKN